MVSGTLRHGLTDDFTVEAHAEATPELAVFGASGVVGLFDFGSMRIAAAGSTSAFGEGGFASATLSTQFGPVNVFASIEGATAEYRDIAALDGSAPPRQTLQLGTGFDLADYGSLSLSYLRIERQNDERATLATATYSVSLGTVTFGVTSVYDAERDALLAETFLSVPLGDGGPYASAGLLAQDHNLEVRATLEQPATPDGGFGYRLRAAQGATTQLNADGRWEGQNLAVDGRLASFDGKLSAQVEAAGSIVTTGDNTFFTRKLDGAFALVDAGEPGVGIYRENRLVAQSDENGVALLTGLVPFTRNHIAVDPGGYDMSRVLARTDLDVVPGRGGAAASLAPAQQNPVSLTVTLPDGSYPDVGTTVHLSGDPNPWIVGYHGALFVADLKLPLEAELETKFGLCRLTLTAPPPPSPGEIPRVGPIACAFDK
jgi:outer membrane usher protein